MYPVDFSSRIEVARTRKKGDLNCIGATFYLLGIDDKERLVDPIRSRARILRSLSSIGHVKASQSSFPENCSAVGVYSNTFQTFIHTGVVLPERDAIVHRSGYGKPLETVTLSDFINSYPRNEWFRYGVSFDYLVASHRQATNWEMFMDKLHEWGL